MGLLALGTAYEWQEAKKYAEHVREHGIEQFLNIWNKLQNKSGDGLLWGDEVRF
jgi:glutamate--cysteine ligase catalytic subunit